MPPLRHAWVDWVISIPTQLSSLSLSKERTPPQQHERPTNAPPTNRADVSQPTHRASANQRTVTNHRSFGQFVTKQRQRVVISRAFAPQCSGSFRSFITPHLSSPRVALVSQRITTLFFGIHPDGTPNGTAGVIFLVRSLAVPDPCIMSVRSIP